MKGWHRAWWAQAGRQPARLYDEGQQRQQQGVKGQQGLEEEEARQDAGAEPAP